jgi:RHS repeat-associated protein
MTGCRPGRQWTCRWPQPRHVLGCDSLTVHITTAVILRWLAEPAMRPMALPLGTSQVFEAVEFDSAGDVSHAWLVVCASGEVAGLLRLAGAGPGRGGRGRGTAGQRSSAGTWPGPGQAGEGGSRHDGAGRGGEGMREADRVRGDARGVHVGAADMSTASYAGEGLRASAVATPSGGSATTQNFVWNTVAQIPQMLMDSANAYIYAGAQAPAEQVNLSSGSNIYLVTDSLGSVRGTVNNSGGLTASTSYDAWGNPETAGGLTGTTPFGFAGGYTDPTGLIYLIDRYYDPQSGQFVSVDLCVPITSSTSCDQPVFVDHAADVRVFSGAVLVEVDRVG